MKRQASRRALPAAGSRLPARGDGATPNNGTLCRRPAAGAVVAEPTDLYSSNGILPVAFNYHTSVDQSGRTLFCFVTPNGVESPTLHLHPGDTLDLTVTNLNPTPPPGSPTDVVSSVSDICGSAEMTITSVNLHFHGTTPRRPAIPTR